LRASAPALSHRSNTLRWQPSPWMDSLQSAGTELWIRKRKRQHDLDWTCSSPGDNRCQVKKLARDDFHAARRTFGRNLDRLATCRPRCALRFCCASRAHTTTNASRTSATTAGAPIERSTTSLGVGSSVGRVVYAVSTVVPPRFDRTDPPASRQAR